MAQNVDLLSSFMEEELFLLSKSREIKNVLKSA